MEALYYDINADKIKPCQIQTILDLARIMGNAELRFYKSFGMEIDDARTVYSLCVRTLAPDSDEPGLCLLKDWLELKPPQ
jgi:hypothetical protein